MSETTTYRSAPPADAAGTAPAESSPAPRRWRRLVLPALLGLVLLGALAAVVLGHGSTSAIPLAPDNPAPDGAQAAATILADQGVQVRAARTTADAVALAGPGTTLFVTVGQRLDVAQLAAVRDTGADIVLTGVTYLADLEPLTSAVAPSPAGSNDPITARCTDPHAMAAGQISRSIGAVRPLEAGVELCFPTEDDAGAYATWREGGRQLSVLADGALLSNDHLAETGNAALALRVLGGNEELVWYIPSIGDTSAADDGADGGAGMLPPQATAVGWQLLVVAAVVVLWGARRLGPVVTEAMPVVVRSAETTLGRGRLYRRGRAHAHAAAGLRAGCASRAGRALGLPHAAPPEVLVAALAGATGRPKADVGRLLYGPPPTTDPELMTLSRELDILESEVHRT